VLAVIPLYVALIEMMLPGGRTPADKGLAGHGAGLCRACRAGLALAAKWVGRGPHAPAGPGSAAAGAFSWTMGSILSRRARLPVNSFVAAAWQMLAAGVFSTALGTVLGQWPQFHPTASAIGSLAYLITGGSLLATPRSSTSSSTCR